MSDPLIFSHGAAATAFHVELGIWVVFETGMTIRQTRRLGHLPRRDPSGLALGACVAGGVVLAVTLARDKVLAWPGGRLWPVVVGLVLVMLGVALRAWSIATLGRFFQYRIEVQADHHVVTGGPYRYVRHPSYTGLLLVLIGIGLASGDVVSLVAIVVLGGAGLAVRIRAEERQLREALGEEYERYASGRARLVPRLL